MPCPKPCPDCDRQGLPILFTRYAASYSAKPESMAALEALRPAGQLQTNPDGIAMQTATCNLRMLRLGCLYVLIERDGLPPNWESYAVSPQGYLAEFAINRPENAKPGEACEVEVRGANMSMVWLSDVKKVRNFWYLFHPDPIDYDHLKREIEPNRGLYMRSFDVAGWANGNRNQKESLEAEQLNAQVLEFAALSNTVLQVAGNEQHFGLMGCTPSERRWGREEEKRYGRHFIDNPGGAAIATANGPYVVTTENPPYADSHGPRLRKIVQYLQKFGGAVVACDDPIGIAQELSLHHLTAAIPYVSWLQQTDAQGVSNQWKQAASASVQTIDAALARRVITAYDDETESLEYSREAMEDHYPGSDSHEPVRWRRPDGEVDPISVAELNRRRREKIAGQIEERENIRAHVGDSASDDARRQVDALCDRAAIAAFDRLHLAEIKKRDDLLDQLAEDLQGWLKSDALIDRAFGRYNPLTGIDSGDGRRCAGQLCAILLQVDSSPKGRQWYGALDAFSADKRNLVWRMLSLNNAEISTEMQTALGTLNGAFPPAGKEAESEEHFGHAQRSYNAAIYALSLMTKTLAAADKFNKELPTVIDPRSRTAARLQAAMSVGLALKDGAHPVMISAVVARFKSLPAGKAEGLIAKAQLLLLAQGKGTEAVAFAKKRETEALAGRDAKQARFLQRQIEKAIEGQIGEAGAQQMRVSSMVVGLNALALLPALARAKDRDDPRTTTELLGTMAGLMGSLRQWRADLYEKVLFKQVPDLVHKTYRAGVVAVTGEERLGLKAGAARYVAAGAAVGVMWDAVDGVTAARQSEYRLAGAYAARSVVGVVTIGGVIAGARYATAPLWLVRLNLTTMIATAALTTAIGALKGDAWANWLQAQPFRKIDSEKISYNSEDRMTRELADALAEIG
jgi:hypothetical protein